MELNIAFVENGGDARKEYVCLSVAQDRDLDLFAIFDTTYLSPGYISNKLRHVYWFKPRAVKKGDFVYLHTGRGKDESIQMEGYVSHRLYWGLDHGVWNDEGDAIVLVNTAVWTTARVRDVT